MKVKSIYFNSRPSLSSALASSLFQTIIRVLIPLLTMPYVYRKLGPADIGDVNWALTFINILTLITSFGLYPYGVKMIGLFKYDSVKINQLVDKILLLRIMAGLTIVLVVGALYLFFDNDIRLLYLLILLPILFGEILGSDWVYFGLQQQLLLTKRFIIGQFLHILLIFTLFARFPTGLSLIIIYVVSTASVLFYNYFTIYEKFSLAADKLKDSLSLIGEGIKTYIITVIMSFYGKIDLIIVGYLINKQMFGILSSDFRVIMLFAVAITSLSMVLLPKSAEYSSKSDTEFNQFNKNIINIKFFLSSLSVILVISGAELIINFLFGKDFEIGVNFLKYTTPILYLFVYNNYLTWNILYVKVSSLRIVLLNLPGVIVFVLGTIVFHIDENYLLISIILYGGNLITAVLLSIESLKRRVNVLSYNYIKLFTIVAITILMDQVLTQFLSINKIIISVSVTIAFLFGAFLLREEGLHLVLKNIYDSPIYKKIRNKIKL